MKYLILSSDPTILSWKSRPAKVKKIEDALNKTRNATWKVEVRYQANITPEVKNGRITHAWYDTLSKPLFLQGNEFLFLHFSKADWTRLALQNTLRGANQRDTDIVGESYGWADENTKRKSTKENQFEQVVLHEISHEIARNIGVLDNTHTYHDANPDISGIFGSYDMALWQTKYQAEKGIRAMLRKVLIEIIKRLPVQIAPTKTLHKRFNGEYRISQGYGIKNAIYKLTGRHIGIDYACPIGTPILAPAHGRITVSGIHGELGNFCYFEYEWEGKKRTERNLHLNAVPEQGEYNAGEVIGFSGNTGFSSGAHYHIDGHWGEVNMGMINSKNWDTLTYDPHIG